MDIAGRRWESARAAPVVVDEETLDEGAIVAPSTVAARSLTMLVAIMTFLCGVIWGAVMLVDKAAGAWSASVLTEVTATVLPLDGEPVDARLSRVAAAMEEAELRNVTVLPATQSEALLAPWLGSELDLSLLPVPRLVTAQRSADADLESVREAVAAIPGASLDDHEGWSDRLSAMARAAATGALGALSLMIAATVLSVAFATRATIAANAVTMEVLHLLGAEDRFIVRAFRWRFMRIGAVGALWGGFAAALLFGALALWSAWQGAGISAQEQALFGDPFIGIPGFAGLAAVSAGIAAVVTFTSQLAVRRHLAKEML